MNISASKVLACVFFGFMFALLLSRYAPNLWNSVGTSFSSFIGKIPGFIKGIVTWFSGLVG